MTVFCIVLSIYRVFTPVLDTPPTEYLTFFITKSLPGAAATVNTYSPPGLHNTLKAHTSIQPNLNNKKNGGQELPAARGMSNIVFRFGNHLIPVDLRGVDIISDNRAGEVVPNPQQKYIGVEPGSEITHFHFEIRLVEDHIGLHPGIQLANTVFHLESPVLGGRAGKRSHLDTVAGDGTHTLVELDMLLHQLRDGHIAFYLDMTPAAVAAIGTIGLRPRRTA